MTSFFRRRPGGASRLWDAYQGLCRSQWLTPAEVEQTQLAQVRELLAHCLRHVPYYRQVLTDAGVTPDAVRTMDDFRRLPLLRRMTYRDRYSDFQAEVLPAGTVAAGSASTSGTSGVPVQVLQTNVIAFWWCAFH